MGLRLGYCDIEWFALETHRDHFVIFVMVEENDVHSSSARTPKLQLAAEQPLTGECWIPPKKDTAYPRAKEKPQQGGRRGEVMFRIKTSYLPEILGGFK